MTTSERPHLAPVPADPEKRHDASGKAPERVAAADLEAERQVLGGLMTVTGTSDQVAEDLDDVLAQISSEQFYRGSHRSIFEAVVQLVSIDGIVPDTPAVADKLASMGLLADVGGMPYLADLVTNTYTSANLTYWAKKVHQHHARRVLADIGHELQLNAPDPTLSEEDVASVAENRLIDLAENGGGTSQATSFAELLKATWEDLDRRAEGTFEGLRTGYTDLDDKLMGMRPKQLLCVAARPGMGKSALVTGIAVEAAKQGAPVTFVSMEMSEAEIIERILSCEARVDLGRIRSGKFKDDDWPKLAQAMGKLAELPIDILAGEFSVAQIRNAARLTRRRHGSVGLVVVDYLQLIQPEGGGSSETRVNDVGAMSRGLKGLAQSLDIPVIMLSQLSRKPEERVDKRPILSDLRESGSLEQDSDAVIFLYRQEYYDDLAGIEQSDAAGEAEIIIAKNRMGERGTAKLIWMGHHQKFANMARGAHSAASAASAGTQGGPPGAF